MIDNILSHILWAVLKILNPSQVKEVSYVMTRCSSEISCHNPKNWPQEMETNWSWNWRLTVLNVGDAGQTTDDQFQDDCQNWSCYFCMEPPPSTYKSSFPLIVSVGQTTSGQASALPPLAASIQNKANFPFHQPGLFNSFWAVSSRILLLDTIVWPTKPKIFVLVIYRGKKRKPWSKSKGRHDAIFQYGV